MTAVEALLPKVKANLILQHDADDELLMGFISAAIDHATKYQHKVQGYYDTKPLPPTTEQAVIMLASHYYESRDGSTAGFYGDSVAAAQQTARAVNDLLRLDREWSV
jgi:uncharacterized phage protein (predicted DNA packaging)